MTNDTAANVLLEFDRAEHLTSVSIMNWEFVTMGPTSMDISNIIAELFFLGYFSQHNSMYTEVLKSFIEAYRALGGLLCLRSTISVVGAALSDLVVRRVDLNGGQDTAAMARECVKLAFDFMLDAGSTDFTLGENDPFSMLSRILRNYLWTSN